jgi:ribosome biogenesis GTPase A
MRASPRGGQRIAVAYNSAVTQQASHQPVFPPQIAPYLDVAAYLLDSRAPAATLYFDPLLKGKELLLLTRSLQADKKATEQWQRYFHQHGYQCFIIDAKEGKGFSEVLDYLATLLHRKLAAASERGIMHATLRLAALGVPNVGKSTFLNQLIGRRRLRTGNVPGITRGRQWVRLFDDVEVLDTPGVLRDPAALNRRKPYWLLLNLMPYDFKLRDDAITLLMETLDDQGWRKMLRYFRVPAEQERPTECLGLLELVAAGRGYSLKGDDEVDRAARAVIKSFQEGRFGRISLEWPQTAQITSPFFSRTAPGG